MDLPGGPQHFSRRRRQNFSECGAEDKKTGREAVMSPKVQIGIVTCNSGRHLKACLESVQAQRFKDISICLWDNASTDETSEIVAAYRGFLSFERISKINVGFCSAHNRLIESGVSEYILALNPDVVLEPDFIEVLVSELDRDPGAGSATGKLLRRYSEPRILDSTGIYFTPNQRHLDRGSGEIDSGQYDRVEYVFGASGAAAFYRRAMLEDIRQGGEYFDESFFAYREDADIAWRAQWMGWNCLYVPQAIAFHKRRVLPEKRPTLPGIINMHSFKNRFLLRIKNLDAGTYARFFIPISARDLAALSYVLLREQSSIAGLMLVLKNFPDTWRKRKLLQSRRRVPATEIRSWFSYTPVSKRKNTTNYANSHEFKRAY
jgi:GT2 family glycosyltransferase